MKWNGMKAVAGSCCLFVPLALGVAMAQSDPTMDQDKTFLMKASQGGMAEVQLGQLAAQKASSEKVKAFGQKMVTDHTMLNNQLKPFADKDGVPPPTSLSPEDQALLDKLSGLSGAEFDKEYVAAMEADHDKDLKDFQQEVATTQDPKLKMAVMKGEKVIEQHHKMIDKIGNQMGVAPASGT
jgi:putative membrane protein